MGFCQRCELGHRDSTDHVVLNQVLSCPPGFAIGANQRFPRSGQLLKGSVAQRGESVELLNRVSDTKVK